MRWLVDKAIVAGWVMLLTVIAIAGLLIAGHSAMAGTFCDRLEAHGLLDLSDACRRDEANDRARAQAGNSLSASVDQMIERDRLRNDAALREYLRAAPGAPGARGRP